MAGPYNLYLTSQNILKNKNVRKTIYMAFLAAAYNNIYGWNNLNGIFKSPYAKNSIPFAAQKTSTKFDAQLTTDLTALFTPEFLSSFSSGTETDFSTALRK